MLCFFVFRGALVDNREGCASLDPTVLGCRRLQRVSPTGKFCAIKTIITAAGQVTEDHGKVTHQFVLPGMPEWSMIWCLLIQTTFQVLPTQSLRKVLCSLQALSQASAGQLSNLSPPAIPAHILDRCLAVCVFRQNGPWKWTGGWVGVGGSGVGARFQCSRLCGPASIFEAHLTNH